MNVSDPQALDRAGPHRLLPDFLGRLGRPVMLRQRIFWSVIPIILILWIVVGGISIHEQRRMLTNEFLKRGEAMAANLAYSSELGVFSEDQQLLDAALRGVMKSPDVAYTYIYSQAGETLAGTGGTAGRSRAGADSLTAEEMTRLFERQEVFSSELEIADARIVEFVAPILSEEARSADEILLGPIMPGQRMTAVGAVRLGISLSALDRYTLRLLQLWGGITVLLLIVSTVSIYALSRRISGPVNRLTGQAKQIAGGLLDQAIPVESRDEIGQLALSFNQMARSLRRASDEKEAALRKIQELNRTLEERILERTAELKHRTIELEERGQALQQSLTEVRAMGEISRAVSSSLDVREVLATIARYAVTLSKSDGCAIFEFNTAEQSIDVVASHNLSAHFLGALKAIALDPKDAVIAEAFQIPNIETARHFRFRDTSIMEGYHSALVVPMGGQKATRGAILFRRAAGSFSYRMVDLLTTLANQSKVAIDNARLFQEVHRREIELERASKHKSQFLANMSHELRTPLNAILGYTELILDHHYGDVPQKMRDVLGRVDHNGRHLLGLINDVLDLSKIEAGQLKLAITDYSIKETVRTVATSIESLAAEKDLELTISTPAKLPLGRGDERRIAQVLLNLVGNAIKFTESGKIALEVGLSGDNFVVSVADTGPGISEDERESIFGEFHQIDNSSTREKGGSGLGLSIAKRIVEMHGGKIWVDSIVGKGSTFWVELPVRSEENKV